MLFVWLPDTADAEASTRLQGPSLVLGCTLDMLIHVLQITFVGPCNNQFPVSLALPLSEAAAADVANMLLEHLGLPSPVYSVIRGNVYEKVHDAQVKKGTESEALP